MGIGAVVLEKVRAIDRREGLTLAELPFSRQRFILNNPGKSACRAERCCSNSISATRFLARHWYMNVFTHQRQSVRGGLGNDLKKGMPQLVISIWHQTIPYCQASSEQVPEMLL